MSGKQQTTTVTATEDFFISSILKKIRNLNKKLQQINDLEKIDPETLKAEQKEKISQRGQVKEQIQEQERIKLWYLQAAQEAGVHINQGQSEKQPKKQKEQKQEQTPEQLHQQQLEQLQAQLAQQQATHQQQLQDELRKQHLENVRSLVSFVYANEFFLRVRPARAEDLRRELGDHDYNELANLSAQYTRALYLTESSENNQSLTSKLDAATSALEGLLQQNNVRSLVQRVTSHSFFRNRTAQELDQLHQQELRKQQQSEVNQEVQRQLAQQAKKVENISTQNNNQLGAIGQEQKEKKLQQQQQQQQQTTQNFQFQQSAEKQNQVQQVPEQSQQTTSAHQSQQAEQNQAYEGDNYDKQYQDDEEDEFIEMSGNNKKKVNEREQQFDRSGYSGTGRRGGRGYGKQRGNNQNYGGKSTGEGKPQRPAHDSRQDKGERQDREGGYRGNPDNTQRQERQDRQDRQERQGGEDRPRTGGRGGHRGGHRGGYRGGDNQKREYQPKNQNNQNQQQEQGQPKKPNFLE